MDISPGTVAAVTKALKPLFDKLGELGAQGFELAVRQNYVYAVQDIVVVLLATIILLVVLQVCRRACQADTYKVWVAAAEAGGKEEPRNVPYKGILDYIARENGDPAAGLACFLIALCIVYLFFFCGELFPIINRLVNPQYQTIMDLWSLVKPT